MEMGALAVVNAFGDVLGEQGRIIAEARRNARVCRLPTPRPGSWSAATGGISCPPVTPP
ncbi:hypothetical protein DFAR_3800018 [Desulfarculales bacterium]